MTELEPPTNSVTDTIRIIASLLPLPEVSDSQDPPSTPTHTITTLRNDRITIRTALLFGIPQPTTTQVLGFTRLQIDHARAHHVTAQKSNTGRKGSSSHTIARCARELATLVSFLPSNSIRLDSTAITTALAL